MRRLSVLGVVAVAALTGAGAPDAQAPTASPRVWTGTWEEHDAWEGHSKYGRQQAQISFVYVQGRDEFGLPRWDSRQLTWNAVWEEHSFDTVALWEGPPDDRGFTMRRYRQDVDTYCAGGHPHLTPEAVDFLVEQQPALVGIDSVNIDDTATGERPVHTGLLGAGIYVLEHLRGLAQLDGPNFEVFAVPVKVAGMGTFPVRAFARYQ